MNTLIERFGFLAPDWRDLVEILIVSWVLYRALLVLAGTRALQMLLGIFAIVALYGAARILNLSLLEYLLERVFEFGVIAALIVFQPELRSALAQLGQNRILRVFSRLEQTQVAEEVTQAAEEMARGKIGAIIAIEREMGLGEYVETGTPLQARVSDALLLNIFTPYSLLHDGAAVIRGDQIVGAGVILPLTQSQVTDRSLGTRHRAALGLSEETDALVVVVSEETGAISLAQGGRLHRGLTPDQLQQMLGQGTAELTTPPGTRASDTL
ncbi:diadenylate cyclase CdaA [Longimicrobium terrae]|uniref:Diadenylate cyclase n=1 Tax=Longimicrobium terrae TaxID=1639882 RepID=A0A841H1I0_9BACT|nr:diadenylate cyclase CdaA [Longimicrobium terrae]MBB4637578.1 diadenylate cyclase [Longimicrobium terrae]MBB6071975.1 diadenylate cyclase [Longimicrobium terrae]NNC30520.1 TIGR00159 family protein [Longimicrobium terrae]